MRVESSLLSRIYTTEGCEAQAAILNGEKESLDQDWELQLVDRG